MKKVLNYLIFFGFALLISACSKEKRVEKWLQKGTGEWQVKTINYKFYENDTLQTDETNDHPIMKYVFDENGNFFIASYLDADQTIINNKIGGSWSSSKDVIFLKYTGGYEDELKIIEIEKRKMSLEGITEYPNSEKYIQTIWLEKED